MRRDAFNVVGDGIRAFVTGAPSRAEVAAWGVRFEAAGLPRASFGAVPHGAQIDYFDRRPATVRALDAVRNTMGYRVAQAMGAAFSMPVPVSVRAGVGGRRGRKRRRATERRIENFMHQWAPFTRVTG